MRGCCLAFPKDESLLHAVDRVLGSSDRKFSALASSVGMNAVMNATGFVSSVGNWHGEAEARIKVCMFDDLNFGI